MSDISHFPHRLPCSTENHDKIKRSARKTGKKVYVVADELLTTALKTRKKNRK